MLQVCSLNREIGYGSGEEINVGKKGDMKDKKGRQGGKERKRKSLKDTRRRVKCCRFVF